MKRNLPDLFSVFWHIFQACVIACGILKSNRDLSEQLKEEFGGGLDIVSASHLPHGSGLGENLR